MEKSVLVSFGDNSRIVALPDGPNKKDALKEYDVLPDQDFFLQVEFEASLKVDKEKAAKQKQEAEDLEIAVQAELEQLEMLYQFFSSFGDVDAPFSIFTLYTSEENRYPPGYLH